MLSTTALHWLEADTLTRVYCDLRNMLRPGGVFLNGDHLAFGPAAPTLARLSERVLDGQWSDDSFTSRGIETAEQWWEALALEPGFEPLLAERAEILAGKKRHPPPGFDAHMDALYQAGFHEVGTIWQVLSNRVLLAVSPPGV